MLILTVFITGGIFNNYQVTTLHDAKVSISSYIYNEDYEVEYYYVQLTVTVNESRSLFQDLKWIEIQLSQDTILLATTTYKVTGQYDIYGHYSIGMGFYIDTTKIEDLSFDMTIEIAIRITFQMIYYNRITPVSFL